MISRSWWWIASRWGIGQQCAILQMAPNVRGDFEITSCTKKVILKSPQKPKKILWRATVNFFNVQLNNACSFFDCKSHNEYPRHQSPRCPFQQSSGIRWAGSRITGVFSGNNEAPCATAEIVSRCSTWKSNHEHGLWWPWLRTAVTKSTRAKHIWCGYQ